MRETTISSERHSQQSTTSRGSSNSFSYGSRASSTTTASYIGKENSSSRQNSRTPEINTDYVASWVRSYQDEAGGETSSQSLIEESSGSSRWDSSSNQYIGTSGQSIGPPPGWSANPPRSSPKPTTSAGGQVMSGGSSRIPYTERDRRASTIPTETMDTAAYSSRSPLNRMTSVYSPHSSTDIARSPQVCGLFSPLFFFLLTSL